MRKRSLNSKLGAEAAPVVVEDAAAGVRAPAADVDAGTGTGEDPTVLSARERREFLARVIRACATEVDPHSDLVQEYRSTEKGEVIKLPDKLRALEMDARLSGEMMTAQAAARAAQGKVADGDLQAALAMIRRVTHGRADAGDGFRHTLS